MAGLVPVMERSDARLAASFERLYRRLGERYVLFLNLVAGASMPPLTVLCASLAIPYLSLSFGRFLSAMAVALPWMTVVAGVAELLVARRLRPLTRWLRGGRPAQGASEAWRAAVSELPRAVVDGGAAVLIGSIPASVFVASKAGADATRTIAAVAVVAACVLAGGAVHFLVWERALRPVVSDLAAQLPSDFEVGQRSMTISTRLLMLVPIMNVLSALIAGAVVSVNQAPAGRVAVGFGVALGVTVLVAVPMTLMLRRSLHRPLSELLVAMGRVEAGDLDTSLPVLAADEIGMVAEHFNSMLDGLRERQRFAEDNVRLVDELRASRARVVAASDDARRQVERDLHDGAQQRLVLLNLKLSVLMRALSPGGKEAALAAELRSEVDAALHEVRDLAHGIYPAVLANEGLPAALREAGDRAAIPTAVDCDGAGRYEPEIEAALYFCCLEALQNAAKHAGEGARATVRLAEHDGVLRLEVTDDGAGFAPADATASSGLQNMTDRIGALGGALEILSTPGAGARIAATVPLAQPRR